MLYASILIKNYPIKTVHLQDLLNSATNFLKTVTII